MESTREARRRKILERGSDRLAFITGQAPSPLLPSIAHPNQEDIQGPGALTVEDYCTDDHELPRTETRNEILRKTELPRCEISNENPRNTSQGGGVELFPKCETGNGDAGAAQQTIGSAEPLINSVVKTSSAHMVDTTHSCVVQTSSHQIFTPSRVSSSISATENIRLVCAVTISLLVVLSYHSYPLGGKVIRNMINFRPIYLVLLTSVTLVLGLLLATQGHENEADARRAGLEDHGLANRVGKALEVGLMLQKLVNALFMDCSLCAVIMIAGIPFKPVLDVV